MKRLIPCLLLASAVGALAQTTLHNGIVLPKQWPPRRAIPTERHEMEVPYLDNKPTVIPINIGRQLFVDNFLISQTNLTSVYHTPTFYENNPVLEPDKEWEKTTEGALYAAPFSDGIWYDETDGKYKMWYLAGAGSIHKQDNQTFYTCYAESKDGKHWDKVNQDVVPGTNIVDTCDRDASTVWLDRAEPDPAKRWKFFNVERRINDKRWQVVLKYSADGIHWSKGVAQSGDQGDRTTAFYNPFTKKWALSLRAGTPVSGRSRFYIEHEDPEMLVSLSHRVRRDADDKFTVFWFTPDDKELRHERFPEVEPGIYNFDAIPYESIMLGFYAAWAGPENNVCREEGIQKRNVVSLGYSRDGFHFKRPTHQPFMNVNETEGAWNWGNMQSINGVPLVVGDSLYFYCSGRRLNNIMWDSYTSTGMATLRRDGFVSLHGDKKGGYIVTEPISFDGKYLFVNVDIKNKKSQLLVEILDTDGNPIADYSGKNAIALKQIDSTKQLVSWKSGSDLSALAGKSLRLRFTVTDGDLYSFWVSPWQTGESRGYTAGGGPGLSPTGIDMPL
jgi:hypothetical protein